MVQASPYTLARRQQLCLLRPLKSFTCTLRTDYPLWMSQQSKHATGVVHVTLYTGTGMSTIRWSEPPGAITTWPLYMSIPFAKRSHPYKDHVLLRSSIESEEEIATSTNSSAVNMIPANHHRRRSKYGEEDFSYLFTIEYDGAIRAPEYSGKTLTAATAQRAWLIWSSFQSVRLT